MSTIVFQMKLRRITLVFFLAIFCAISPASLATEIKEAPVSFKIWREQQILEAQNRLTQLLNQLVLVSAGKIKGEKAIIEKGIAKYQRALALASDLTPTEYYIGYLSQFQDKPEALQVAAGLLTKDEIVELMQSFFKANLQNLAPPSSTQSKALTRRLEARLEAIASRRAPVH